MNCVQQCFTNFILFVSPSSQQTEQENRQNVFLDQFPDFLHLLRDGKEVIVVGDINCHFENKHNSEVCK